MFTTCNCFSQVHIWLSTHACTRARAHTHTHTHTHTHQFPPVWSFHPGQTWPWLPSARPRCDAPTPWTASPPQWLSASVRPECTQLTGYAAQCRTAGRSCSHGWEIALWSDPLNWVQPHPWQLSAWRVQVRAHQRVTIVYYCTFLATISTKYHFRCRTFYISGLRGYWV